MKTFGCKRNFSIFSKIILGFLLVVVPLYIFSIQVNIWGQNDVKKEIIESSKARSSFYLASLESEFSNILRIQTKMINDSDLLQLTYAEKTGRVNDYTFFTEINSIRNRLVDLKEISSLVDAAYVYIPSINIKISNLIITEMSEKEFNGIKILTAQRTLPFSKVNDSYYINITSSDSNLTKDNSLVEFIISVRLSTTKVESMLSKLSANSESRAILIGGKHGLNVARKSDEELVGYFKNYLEKQDTQDKKPNIGTIITPQGKYIISYTHSKFLDSELVIYEIEENIMSILLRHKAWLWIMSLLTVVMIIVFSFWIRGMIIRPLSKLLNAFKKVEDGKLNIMVSYNRNDEFGILYNRFNEMFEKLRILIEQVYEQKIYAREAELKQLQYQINPHFLYNSILIINNLIKMSDFECAQKLTQHLGKYYQYITKTITDEVPLQKEVNHMRDYMEIQSIRFQNRIEMDVDEVPYECRNIMVPRLILQPVVENAFNHGLKEKVSIGKLRILLKKYENYFHIFIEDNGDNLSNEKLEYIQNTLLSSDVEFTRDSSALTNVHRRIRIKFGCKSGMWVTRGQMGGLCVEIRIELS